MIGLAGSHRTGKTTLAEAFAVEMGYQFISTNVSEWQREIGYDSSDQSYDFKTKMFIQEHILNRLSSLYDLHKLGAKDTSKFITDRTPIDLMMYTLSAVNDSLTDEDFKRLDDYMQQCFDVLNRHFSAVVLIQPAIPIQERIGAAKGSRAYMEKLNTIATGLMYSSRNKTPRLKMPTETVKLSDRVKLLSTVCSKTNPNSNKKPQQVRQLKS